MSKNLTCSVEDCTFDVKQIRRGLCGTHYARYRRLGTTVLVPMTRAVNGATREPILDSCKVDVCEEQVWAKNLCNTHYNRQIRQGTTELVGRKTGKEHPSWRGGRSIVRWGYVEVYVPEEDLYLTEGSTRRNRMLEHRYVMAKHLGRALTSEENIHHINGIKDDNRLENLELWSTSQPKGQRVSDKLKWAKEFIDKYGSLLDD